ncbi:MAG TPA: glycosyltransferase family 2 protein [Pirellulaceae bacterium]|nr:glycosyltransferase family 2 protein [Pirellulaceae bacterium]HMO93450.1 glycosyltransferase family 2 protein [Pirellulaceae bacterium]HMP68442.1 glycosyltransferase family 2 protein [Pirellulaceae bacterium]
MNERQLITVVTPVYGCRNCLNALVDGVRDAFEGSDFEWELVLVDDRASDNPWSLIVQLAKDDSRIRGIRLTKNHGQHLAIWAGFEVSRGDWIAVIDCDLQDDPRVIPELHKKAIAEEVDGVVVDRGEWLDTGFRRLASKWFYGLMETLSGLNLKNNIGNFGLYSRRLVNLLLRFRDKEVFLPLMISLTGLPLSTQRLDRKHRHSGKSTYNIIRLTRMALAIMIRFSDRPLKFSVVLGSLFSFVSAIFSVFLVLAWATGAFTVPGWTSLILSLWFLIGLTLAVLGIHGIYIGRIFAEVQDRPRIFIESTTEVSPPNKT